MTRLAIDVTNSSEFSGPRRSTDARKSARHRQQKATARADASEPPSAFLVTSLQKRRSSIAEGSSRRYGKGRRQGCSGNAFRCRTKPRSAKGNFGRGPPLKLQCIAYLPRWVWSKQPFIHEVNAISIWRKASLRDWKTARQVHERPEAQ